MTIDEIMELSKEALQEKVKAFYSNAESAQSYLAIQGQISAIAEQIDTIDININSDASDKAFERFLNFSQKLNVIEKSQRERLAMLDEEVLRMEKERRNSAKSGRLEQFVNEGFMTKKDAKKETRKKV